LISQSRGLGDVYKRQVSAGAAMLPLVGSTVGRTLGLYALGGPGGYMAQQVATREILKQAGFAEQAKGYDPFDPLGLTLATVIPAPFAAMGLRGIRSRAKYEAETRAIMDGNSEAVEAARVQMLSEVQHNANRAAPDDLVGQARHSEAMDTALHQVVTGEPVRVEVTPDMAARIEAEMAPRIEPVLKRLDDERKMMEAAEGPPRREPLADIMPMMRDARAALAGADLPAALKQLEMDGKLTPEMNNAMIAVSEFGSDPVKMGQLLKNYVGESGRAGEGAQQADVIARAVETTRNADKTAGQTEQPNAFDQHAERLRVEKPDMPVELPGGERTTLSKALDAIKAEHDMATSDANLAMVAAQCALESLN
jgi:hypothetical protein